MAAALPSEWQSKRCNAIGLGDFSGGEEGWGKTGEDWPASKIAFIWHIIDSQHLVLFN